MNDSSLKKEKLKIRRNENEENWMQIKTKWWWEKKKIWKSQKKS